MESAGQISRVSAAAGGSEPNQALQPKQAGQITVRLSAPDQAPVDLRVSQRGPELKVDVRSADQNLNQSLRQDLDSLVQSLDKSGLRTEQITKHELLQNRTELAFTGDRREVPVLTSSATNDPAGREGDQRQQHPDSDQTSQHRQQQQQQDQQQSRQGQRHPRAPKAQWMEALRRQSVTVPTEFLGTN